VDDPGAGLRNGAQNPVFVGHFIPEGAASFTATRFDGKASVDLTVSTAEAAQDRVRSHRNEARTLISGGVDETHGWFVLAREFRDSALHGSLGLVVHDGAWLEVRPARTLGVEEAKKLEAMLKGAAERLAIAYTTDLRPFIERAAERKRR
jgi:hypothetical protein